MAQIDPTKWALDQLRKFVTIEEARVQIATVAKSNGLILYQITDLAEKLNLTFESQSCFPFDFTDEQSEIYLALMKAQGAQRWSGLDLKAIVYIISSPCDHKLSVVISLFKRLPKSVQLNWTQSPSGDNVIAPGPSTPYLMAPGSPVTPEISFRPLTQMLNPRSNKLLTPVRVKPEIVPFSLNLSTISASSGRDQSTPDKPLLNTSPANSSKVSNSSNRSRLSPIIKARKRYSISPTPKEIRARNSRILDGSEPVPKRAKLDKSVARRRNKAKARRSIKSFLNNLIQSNIC